MHVKLSKSFFHEGSSCSGVLSLSLSPIKSPWDHAQSLCLLRNIHWLKGIFMPDFYPGKKILYIIRSISKQPNKYPFSCSLVPLCVRIALNFDRPATCCYIFKTRWSFQTYLCRQTTGIVSQPAVILEGWLKFCIYIGKLWVAVILVQVQI